MLDRYTDHIVYQCVDGTTKLILEKGEYEKLREYIRVCDGLLDRIVLNLQSEPNVTLTFSENFEKYKPALVEYAVYFKGGKISEEEWLKIRNIKKERYYERINQQK